MAGGFDSGFGWGYGYDGRSVFPPGRHLVGVDALGKIFYLPSFPETVSCAEEGVMPNVGNGMAVNTSYNRTL